MSYVSYIARHFICWLTNSFCFLWPASLSPSPLTTSFVTVWRRHLSSLLLISLCFYLAQTCHSMYRITSTINVFTNNLLQMCTSITPLKEWGTIIFFFNRWMFVAPTLSHFDEKVIYSFNNNYSYYQQQQPTSIRIQFAPHISFIQEQNYTRVDSSYFIADCLRKFIYAKFLSS